VSKVAQDNDAYLGDAIRFHGNAYLTIHLLKGKDSQVPEETKKLAVERFTIKNVMAKGALIKDTPGIQPPILPIASRAKGLGFTNVVIDPDGVRRRINLVARYGDAYFPQLVFSPLLDILGNPGVTVERHAITLKDARLPDGSVRSVRIPLDSNGHFIVNWPHKKFLASFTHMSFAELIQHKEYFDTLIYNLRLRDSWGYLDLYRGDTPLLELYRQSETLRKLVMDGEEKPEAVAGYRVLRDRFLAEVGAFLDEKPRNRSRPWFSRCSPTKTRRRRQGPIPQDRRGRAGIFRGAPRKPQTAHEYPRGYHRENRRDDLHSGTDNNGLDDIGINPFDNEYPNSRHARLGHQHDPDAGFPEGRALVGFRPDSRGAHRLLVFALSNTKTDIHDFQRHGRMPRRLRHRRDCLHADRLLHTDLQPSFQYSSRSSRSRSSSSSRQSVEKGFIRNAFGHYLSEAVIKDIVGNPDKLKLGGELRNMTAIFTDIRGFSTISEKLSAEELVRLLNEYLTGMSDCILDMGGTIDKYEGDAIICFFGAPLDLPDHALKACQAAIKMKRIEAALNEKFLETGMAPSNLMTRIGINTGDMVVGNMGTTKKMDYTIMGDAVNLAARLEGVNKQYGTWLCISEDTMTAANSGIEVRRLDRIRVVGKSQPIRIYELVEERGKLTKEQAEMIERFEAALEEIRGAKMGRRRSGVQPGAGNSP
jgi:adenylate cyclase